jgi:two-component system phosphate regulon sensor histidine kinase PhoR
MLARARRTSDFALLVGAAAAVLAALVLVGELAFWSGLLAGSLIGTFALAYFVASSDADAPPAAARAAASSEREGEFRARSERAFRSALIEALPEPAMYIDAEGRVEAANAAARSQFRFVGAEPLLSAVVRRPELLDAVALARADGEAQMFEFVERDETDRHFSCVAAPVNTASSSGVLVTMHDLTAIKRAEMARADFLANASHELRTPLTSLSGFIETMRGPARKDPEAWDRFLEIMQGQTERMRRLIHDLLSLSRIELNEHKLPDTVTDLASVVAEVADALGPVAAEREVRLRVSGPASDVLVLGVRDELAQVAQNLIDNAIKYSEAGGAVEIEVLGGLPRVEAAQRAGRRWQGAGHMSIATAPPSAAGDFAVLRVADAGSGIDRQHLPRLAERFYRVDPGRGLRRGTGLGLAIVKHVVTRHRGEFLVESEPGRGSAFGVLLPIAPAALRGAEAPVRGAAAPAAAASGGAAG